MQGSETSRVPSRRGAETHSYNQAYLRAFSAPRPKLNFHLILLGFAAAALVVTTGVGGGALMAPALILGCGMSPPVAVGTDLIYAALTKTGALWIYTRRGRVHWRIVLLMLAGSVPATLAASAALWLVRGDNIVIYHIVDVSLGGALCLSSVAIAFGEPIRSLTSTRAGKGPRFDAISNWVCCHRTVLVVILGVVVGLLVPLSSVGTGAIGVAALMLLFPSISPSEIVGTDIAYGLFLAATAGLGHLLLRNIDFGALSSLLIGMVPGVYVGGLFAGSLSETVLRLIISLALLGAAVKLFGF